jgi:hypothetical protein
MQIEMTLNGVLLAGGWRDAEWVKQKSDDEKRNTVITEVDKQTKDGPNPQGLNNDELAGRAAVIILLIRAGFATPASLKKITDVEQRKLLILANAAHTGIPLLELEGLSNQVLVNMGLKEWFEQAKIPFKIEMTLEGALLASGINAEWAKKQQDDSKRERLIQVVGSQTKDASSVQGLSDNQLIGKAAILVFLFEIGLYDHKKLSSFTGIEHRQLLIKAIDNNTAMARSDLQNLGDYELVVVGLCGLAKPKPKPVAALGDGKTMGSPLLIDPVRKILDPEDSFYVHTATHFIPTRDLQFNTLENLQTKSVRISGVKLVFDHGNDYRKQMAFHGKQVLDLKKLEIIADQVIICKKLDFPRTEVTIYARELIFEDQGCIDTTPAAFNAPAESPKKVKVKDNFYPANEKGEPIFVAADGKHGEQAGDIHLYVRQIINKRSGKVCLIAKGSNGQAAEKGSLKPYEPKSPDQPKDSKNLRPVTIKDITDHLSNGLSGVEEKRENSWRWPNSNGGFGSYSLSNTVITDDALKSGKIVNLKLILHSDNAYTCRARRTFFPSMDSKRTVGCEVLTPLLAPNPVRYACVEGELASYKKDVDGSRKKPGDGEDAYPSGRPGDGGNGGNIVSCLAAAPVEQQVCDVGEGLGSSSETITGGSPGTPTPAYWADMYVVMADSIDSPHNPYINLTNVSAKKGADAAGKTSNPGKKGSVANPSLKTTAWVHPEAVRAVITYAQDIFRNGHRDKAKALLHPYYYRLSYHTEELSGELIGNLTDIIAILSNIDSNLDYFGNPPGWVPRLGVEANYEIWDLFSKESSKLYYFAAKMENSWDAFNDESTVVEETTTAVKDNMEATRVGLTKAYADFKLAKEAVDTVQDSFEAKQRDIDDLRNKAAQKARDKINEQRIFKGAMKLIGGLAEAIPIGQPYLGLAGKTLGSAGDIDWNQPDTSKQFGTFFTKLSKQTEDFMEKNDSLLIERSGNVVPKPDGTKLTDLKTQITKAKGAVDAVDGDVNTLAKQIKTEWDDAKKAERDRLSEEIKAAGKKITALAAAGQEKASELEVARKEETALKEEFAKPDLGKLGEAKKQLEDELKKLTKQVEDSAKAKLAEKKALLKTVEGLEKKKTDFEGQVTDYKENKKAAQTKTKELLTNLSGLADGIAQVGQGIVALTAPYDEKEVDRLANQILEGSEFKEDYWKLLNEVKALNIQKAAAVGQFCFQQKLISTYTSNLASAMLELNALSNQRQVAYGVLDIGLKTYLRAMQERAKESLLWAQYHFIKALQYENLSDPGDDFANMEHWTTRFFEFEQQKLGIKETKKKISELKPEDQIKINNTFLSQEDFTKIGETVRKGYLLNLIKDICDDREKFVGRTKKPFKCILNDIQRDQLKKEGKLCFNFIKDFHSISFNEIQATISDINLEVFELTSSVDPKKDALPISIEFIHSGISILLSKNDKYYKFQKSPKDTPIIWGYTYNHGDYLRLLEENDKDDIWSFSGKKPIKKNEKIVETVNKFIESKFGEPIRYKEYMPSAFSDITLWLNRGQFDDADDYQLFLNKITIFERLEFTVDIISSEAKFRNN